MVLVVVVGIIDMRVVVERLTEVVVDVTALPLQVLLPKKVAMENNIHNKHNCVYRVTYTTSHEVGNC